MSNFLMITYIPKNRRRSVSSYSLREINFLQSFHLRFFHVMTPNRHTMPYSWKERWESNVCYNDETLWQRQFREERVHFGFGFQMDRYSIQGIISARVRHGSKSRKLEEELEIGQICTIKTWPETCTSFIKIKPTWPPQTVWPNGSQLFKYLS